MKKIHLLLPLAVGFLTPPLLHLWLKTAVGGVPVATAVREVLGGYLREGNGDLFLNLYCLTPFAALPPFLWMASFVVASRRLPFLFWGALLPMAFLHFSVHDMVWRPVYDPSLRSSSTAVLALLWLPPFLTFPTMLFGAATGFALSFLPRFREPAPAAPPPEGERAGSAAPLP